MPVRIVYSSFDGRFSDSPRALHRALAARERTGGAPAATHTWLAADAHRAAFPADVATVPSRSPEAVAALEAADLVVANTHLGVPWRKAPGARYLQTWHGTPMKRIAADELARTEGAPVPGAEDIARWDLLLSPNRTSTARLRRAFAYAGEVAETGLPRNDALLAPSAPHVRRRVRERLGIADGVTAVLYTPTWRDDVLDAQGRRDVDLQLDLEAFSARLGRDHVLLLRLHYMVSDRLGPVAVPGVLDVSGEPDVAELYLAADAMVTDYSSTMVDFAVTGKPLLFFTYDLEHYRDRVRGLYLDLPAVAPGPLVATTGELLDALADLPAVVRASADRYAAFRAELCHLDDGRATERALERLLGPAPGPPPVRIPEPARPLGAGAR